MRESLGDAFPREIQRCTRLLGEYRSIGPAGQFGAAMIQQTLDEATDALATGDVVAMIRIFPRLQDHK
jgi:hypothetical protein